MSVLKSSLSDSYAYRDLLASSVHSASQITPESTSFLPYPPPPPSRHSRPPSLPAPKSAGVSEWIPPPHSYPVLPIPHLPWSSQWVSPGSLINSHHSPPCAKPFNAFPRYSKIQIPWFWVNLQTNTHTPTTTTITLCAADHTGLLVQVHSGSRFFFAFAVLSSPGAFSLVLWLAPSLVWGLSSNVTSLGAFPDHSPEPLVSP